MANEIAFTDPIGLAPPIRLLIVADQFGPAQEAGFLAPLARWRDAGAAAIRVIDEPALDALRADGGENAVRAFLERQFAEFRPTAFVLSRYAGRDRLALIGLARAYRLPLVYHLNENLLDAPIALGAEQYRRLRHPRRFHDLYRLLDAADLVQTATPQLGEVVRQHFPGKPLAVTGDVIGPPAVPYSSPARSKAAQREVRIGFIGSEARAFDFELAAAALHQAVREMPRVRLYLLGAICDTLQAKDFGDLATHVAVEPWHETIRQKLAELDIDIAVCPLRESEFNACEAPTDWADWAAVGVPLIASATPTYRALAAENALALCPDDGWGAAIVELVKRPARRNEISAAAGRVLAREFSPLARERAVLDLIASATVPTRLAS